MRIVIKGEGRWKKISLELPPELEETLRSLAEEYGFTFEETLKILLKGDFLDTEEDVNRETLQLLLERALALEKQLYELEGKWSPLKFKTYYLAMDNQNLAIQLAAMIAQNKRLREKAGLPSRDYGEIEKKIHYYLNFGKKGE